MNKQPVSDAIIAETMSLLAFAMSQTKHDVFVEWAAHIDQVIVYVYRNSWHHDEDADVTFREGIYVDGTLCRDPVHALRNLKSRLEAMVAKWDAEDAAKAEANLQPAST